MTEREFQIARALLAVLHDRRGGQFTDLQLQAATDLRLASQGITSASTAEFDTVLKLVDGQRWITGIIGLGGRRKWNINDAGEAALLEMQ